MWVKLAFLLDLVDLTHFLVFAEKEVQIKVILGRFTEPESLIVLTLEQVSECALCVITALEGQRLVNGKVFLVLNFLRLRIVAMDGQPESLPQVSFFSEFTLAIH